MACDSSSLGKGNEADHGGDDDDEGVFQEDEGAPSHLPLAPSSQVDDISTTVDPSYIISLIRQLLPHHVSAEKNSENLDYFESSGQLSDLSKPEQDMTHRIHKTVSTNALEVVDSLQELVDNHAEDIYHCSIKEEISTASSMGNGMNQEVVMEERTGYSDDGQTGTLEAKDPWEDCGCILWDLSASRSHAELMVKNLVLEVILATLHISKSSRVTEICLGIIGNLACHETLSSTIVSTDGLLEAVIDQLFLDDSTCLCETFRLLTVGFQSSRFVCWAEALLPEQILQRILWVVGNTLNSTLLEKSLEFLLAIIDNQDLANMLLEPLLKLGLPNFLVNLLASEVSKLRDESKLERSNALDIILHVIEGLSTTNSHSQVISSNNELFRLLCDLIKVPEKIEIASSCACAVVIVANLLVDNQHLISGLSQDILLLNGLLDVLPLVSDDSQARSALWCVLAKLLLQVQENNLSMSILDEFAAIFLEKSCLIEEDLGEHSMEILKKDSESINASELAVTVLISCSVRKIACIVEKWMDRKAFASSHEHVDGADDFRAKVQKLLQCCQKHAPR